MSQLLNNRPTSDGIDQAPSQSYRLIRSDPVGSFLLECDSGVSIYIHKEIIPVIVNVLRLMNLFLNEESIRYLVDYFSIECDSEVSTIYIHKDTISLIANGLLLIMKLFLNKGQLPYQLRTCLMGPSSDCHSPPILNYQQTRFPTISFSNTEQPSYRFIRRYLVGPLSPTSPPNDRGRFVFVGSIEIPEEIILNIARYLTYFDIIALELVCRGFFATLRPKWPLIRFSYSKAHSTQYYRSHSPMGPPNDWEGFITVGSIDIPGEIILDIVRYLTYSDRRVLELVCRGFSAIIRSKWPPIRFTIVFGSNENKKLQKRYLYNLYMEFREKRIIYQDKNVTNDPDMGSVYYFRGTMDEDPLPLCECYFGGTMDEDPLPLCECYFRGTMNEQPHPLCKMGPSRWQVMRLEGVINNFCNLPWADHLRKCKNLVFLGLKRVNNISLYIPYLTKLKGFFIKPELIDGSNITIHLPPSVKAIAVYASEEKDQECRIQSSKRWIQKLNISTSDYPELEFG
jgi:hypothetical protein